MFHRAYKLFLFLFVCLLFFGIGFKWHSHNLWPLDLVRKQLYKEIYLPQEYKDKILVKYSSGIPLFTDRTYYDSIGDPRLDGLILLQIPRHLKESEVRLNVSQDIVVYRMIISEKDLQIFDDYNRTDIKVNVQSIKHVHTEIISKSFLKGNIVLKTGVRYSSAPILIKAKDSDIQIEIQNQFNVSDSVNPVYL